MDRDYTLAIKTVRHSEYADEYEGRDGLMKLPYKMLLQQSEIRNGQLLSENDELRDTINALNARIAELEAEAEALTDQIKGAMVDRGEESISCPSWNASWKNVTSSRFDTKAFKAAQPEVYSAFTKQTTTCRFTISPTAA